MPDTNKKYYGKVLLFGEYALIHGSPALARPTDLFSASWDFDDSLAAEQSLILNPFHAYCAKLKLDGIEYKADAFSKDLNHGLIFKSNLPIGYGVGSSGALTAAIFDQYFNKSEQLELIKLKQVLGSIESYFHGKSSGFDPLICYLNKAVKIDSDIIHEINKAEAPDGFSFFLLNTEKPRKTGPLVETYLKRYEADSSFRRMIKNEMTLHNRKAITQTLDKDGEGLFDSIEAISRLQWEFLEAMIPANTKKIWAQSFTTTNHRIKLCGAGGGGFLLGLSKDMEQTRRDFTPFECLIVSENK
jgi:mevalonate kinase